MKNKVRNLFSFFTLVFISGEIAGFNLTPDDTLFIGITDSDFGKRSRQFVVVDYFIYCAIRTARLPHAIRENTSTRQLVDATCAAAVAR